MRRLLILLVAVLATGAAAFHLLQAYPGFVMVAVGTYTLTMNLWLTLVLIAVLAVLGVVCWRLLGKSVRGLAGVTRFLPGSRRARKLTSRGLVDFIEGNWKQGRRRLVRAAPNSEMPLVNLLAAARCAYELGADEDAMTLLHRAEQVGPESGLAVALTQARMQIHNKKFEQAAASLQRARQQAPRHPVVLDLLAMVYEALGDWRGLQQIMPDLRRIQLLSEAEMTRLNTWVSQQHLRQLAEAVTPPQAVETRKALQRRWKQLAPELQQDVTLLQIYLNGLRRGGDDNLAERALRDSLSAQWSPEGILLYGELCSSDPARQLLKAEQWLSARPSSPELLLTLGRLSLRNQLWGKARDYFENSLRIQRRPDTCAELARLLASLGETQRSAEVYQQGLLQVTAGLPELPQPQARVI